MPDAELEYQLWAAPLARPYAVDEAEMHMVGVSQVFPAWGSLRARGLAASEQAFVVAQERRSRELELVVRVRRAYAEYRVSSREADLHREHAGLAGQILEATRSAYQGGGATQQEVVRATLELSRLHRDLANVDRTRLSAQALLNVLMARRADAPLGPPSALEPVGIEVRFADLWRKLGQHRPELAAADGSIRAREHELDEARANAHFPTLMLGAQYMYMPPSEAPHNYGVTLSMSVPWLNPRHGEQVEAAEATLAAERSARASVESALQFELYSAVQRFASAQESWRLADQTLIPLAEQSYRSAQASYRAGQGDARTVLDASRDLLDLRVERERAIAGLGARRRLRGADGADPRGAGGARRI